MAVRFGSNFSGRPDWYICLGTIGREGRNITGHIKWPLRHKAYWLT